MPRHWPRSFAATASRWRSPKTSPRRQCSGRSRPCTARIKNGTAVILSFGGYGIQTGRQTYLIPVNAQIWTEAEVRRDGIGIDTVLAELNARGASVKVAILDASRRNPFERRFRGLSAGLAPVTAPRGTLVISAAAPGTVVNDTTEENSLFVQELLKEMRSPGLTIEEVFNRTRIGVSRASKGEQVPWISSSLVEDFYLNKAPPAGLPAPPPGRRRQVAADADAGSQCRHAPRLRIRRTAQHQEGLGRLPGQAQERLVRGAGARSGGPPRTPGSSSRAAAAAAGRRAGPK